MNIETENLLIRPFEPNDVDDVLAYMSDPNTTYYLPEGVLSRQEVVHFITKNSKAFAIILRDDSYGSSGKLVGHIEFYAWFGEHTYEIGWALNPQFHRRGLAFEAASAVLTYGFNTLGIHRVVATAQPENTASHSLMDKLGMLREGHFRQCIPKGDGVWWDEYFYSILHYDYKSKRNSVLND